MTRHVMRDFDQARRVIPQVIPQGIPQARRDRGRRANNAGLSAEAQVASCYDERDALLLESRWRGRAGEVDLIFEQAGVYIFVEVKQARCFDTALHRLQPAQMRRIHDAAAEYLAFTPLGQLSEVRFDLALCNAQGQVEILEGAFSHF